MMGVCISFMMNNLITKHQILLNLGKYKANHILPYIPLRISLYPASIKALTRISENNICNIMFEIRTQ